MFAELRATLRVGWMFVLMAALLENASANPNHLEPIPAYDPDGYDQAVFGALIGRGYPELWMVCKASFSPEFALILRSEPLTAELEIPPAPSRPRRWILEKATATKQIWHWREYPENYSGPIELDLRKDVQVNRTRLEIDESLGQEIKKAWVSVLRLTRYSEEGYRGIDGTTYQFYAQHDLFGQIWSPRDGLPKQLVELAGLLCKVTECAPEERNALLAQCESKAKELLERSTTFKVKPQDISK